MENKNDDDLHLRDSSTPVATVEIDLDSIPEHTSFPSLLQRTALSFRAKNLQAVATIYVYFGPSINFRQPTSSAFVAVVGNKKLFEMIHETYSGEAGVSVRYSDYIHTSQGEIQLHIEAGSVWAPDEPGTWYAVSADRNRVDPTQDLDDEGLIEDDVEEEAGQSDVMKSGARADAKALRLRAARSDATVGSIRKEIERVFGLPAGSVALCGPDRKVLRSDALIGTLRDRWES